MSIVFFFAGLFGAPVKTSKAIIYKDLKYGKENRQVVDFCIPKNASGEVNLYLNIHGGAWIAGDKSAYFDTLEAAADAFGICTAAMNYRYISDASHGKEILDDVTSCLQKIKDTAAEKGVSIKKVMLSGASAGAHISMLYAYSRVDEAPIKPVAVMSYSGPTDMTDDNFYHNNALGNEDALCTLASQLCGFNFTYAEKESAKAALEAVSPLYYVNENTVPTIICHGAVDSIVPFSNAVSLDAKLTEYGVKHEFIVYPNSNHGLESDSESAKLADKALIEYATAYLK